MQIRAMIGRLESALQLYVSAGKQAQARRTAERLAAYREDLGAVMAMTPQERERRQALCTSGGMPR
jgi:hypothetical protein